MDETARETATSPQGTTEGVNQADLNALLGAAADAAPNAPVASAPSAVAATTLDSAEAQPNDSEPGAPISRSAPPAIEGVLDGPRDLGGEDSPDSAFERVGATSVALEAAPSDFTLDEFTVQAATSVSANKVALLHDVNLRVRIELGRTQMLVEDVLRLGEGSVVELDKLAGDPVDVFVNDRLIARGEVLVLNDSFCVRISEVLSNDPHRVNV